VRVFALVEDEPPARGEQRLGPFRAAAGEQS